MRFGFTNDFALVNKKAARVVQTLAASDHFVNNMNLSLIKPSSRIVLPASRQSFFKVLSYFDDTINGKP